MNNFSSRCKLIYIPFLVVAIGFIGIYSLLNWLLIIRIEVPLNEELVHYWLAVILPWIPVLIWIRPRLKLLILKDKKGNLPFLYLFAAACAIAIPTVILQEYLTTATGELTIVQNVNEIKNPFTKYYKLKRYFIDKEHVGVYKRTETSGRNNETLILYVDVACPILAEQYKPDTINRFSYNKEPLFIVDGKYIKSTTYVASLNPIDIASIDVIKSDDAIPLYGPQARNGAVIITTKRSLGFIKQHLFSHLPKAWLCIEFSQSMSNRGSQEEKEQRFREFDTTSQKEFIQKDLSRFVYLDRIGTSSKHKGYIRAIKGTIDTAVSKPLIFEAVNEPFESRNGDKLSWVFKSFGIGALIWLLMIIIPKVNPSLIDEVSKSTLQSEWVVFKNSVSLIHFKLFQITTILIAINVLVFIIMVFAGLGFMSFDAHDLLAWGADYRPYTINGQWWRLLTSIFLHGGLMHLILNMYGLFVVAIFLEPFIGRLRYASAYLICGIVASCASIWWHPATISVGASGAIFGLYGVLTALLTTTKMNLKGKKSLLLFSIFFIVINLIVGLSGGIDNAAHIGGLLTGLLLGYLFSFFLDIPLLPDDDLNNDGIIRANDAEQQ
jgi:rhomboid protease GluP